MKGHARARRYVPTVPTFQFTLAGADEDEVFEQVRARLDAPFSALTKEEMSVIAYTFTEMVNNAIDHSRGKQLRVRVEIDSKRMTLEVVDDGIGAFESVRAGRSLRNHIEAPAEITKGKVTSDPARHTGEGVFFTSKVADHFVLGSNGVELVVDNEVTDHAIREVPLGPGTTVRLSVSRPLLRTPAPSPGQAGASNLQSRYEQRLARQRQAEQDGRRRDRHRHLDRRVGVGERSAPGRCVPGQGRSHSPPCKTSLGTCSGRDAAGMVTSPGTASR